MWALALESAGYLRKERGEHGGGPTYGASSVIVEGRSIGRWKDQSSLVSDLGICVALVGRGFLGSGPLDFGIFQAFIISRTNTSAVHNHNIPLVSFFLFGLSEPDDLRVRGFTSEMS